MTFILAFKNKNKIIWFIFPLVCMFSFLSMQTPSAFILLILLGFVILYFKKVKITKT